MIRVIVGYAVEIKDKLVWIDKRPMVTISAYKFRPGKKIDGLTVFKAVNGQLFLGRSAAKESNKQAVFEIKGKTSPYSEPFRRKHNISCNVRIFFIREA